MKTGTGIFVLALVILFGQMFEFEIIKEQQTVSGSQIHVLRYNRLTGKIDTCVADYNDDTWAVCGTLSDNEED